jgi:hypothetical protein
MKAAMYIMAPEPISTAYFINPSHQYVVRFISSIVARQRLGRHVPVATITSNNRSIVESAVFYTVRVISKESRRLEYFVLNNFLKEAIFIFFVI